MKILSKIVDEPGRKIEVLFDKREDLAREASYEGSIPDRIIIRQWTAGAAREVVDITMSCEEAKKLVLGLQEGIP